MQHITGTFGSKGKKGNFGKKGKKGNKYVRVHMRSCACACACALMDTLIPTFFVGIGRVGTPPNRR